MERLKVLQNGKEIWLKDDKTIYEYDVKNNIWSFGFEVFGDMPILMSKRTEALARMPKRVEFEEMITSQVYFQMGGKWIERLNFKQKHPYINDHQKVEYHTDESLFTTGQKVKVIIEEIRDDE